jgi:hypothetical protein
MSGATWVFAEARGFKAEADRARALARTASGHLQGELHRIVPLYERIADCKDPDYLAPIFRRRSPKMKQISRFCAAWPEE